MAANDINRDELRRQVRGLAATTTSHVTASQHVFTSLVDGTVDPTHARAGLLGRRQMFRLGGLTIGAAAVIAACGESGGGEIGRVGVAPSTSSVPAGVVNNIALLRTASSLEHSAIAVYQAVVGNRDLLDKAFVPIVQQFMADHEEHAALFEKLTKDAGGTPWTCGNPRIDSALIAPVIERITKGVAAIGSAKAIPASDNPKRDVLNFAHALESLAGATYQSLVGLFSDPKLRLEAITIGAREVRHAALLALTINPDRPGGYVNEVDAENAQPSADTVAPATTVQNIAAPPTTATASAGPPLTDIPRVTAIPSQFGILSGTLLVVGAGDENGVRLKASLETPSLNSLVYEYLTPTC